MMLTILPKYVKVIECVLASELLEPYQTKFIKMLVSRAETAPISAVGRPRLPVCILGNSS